MPQKNADFKGRHILLVEDNELNREIAQEILREYGFRVDTAETVQWRWKRSARQRRAAMIWC